MGTGLRIFLTREEDRSIFELSRATTVLQKVTDGAEVISVLIHLAC
jgi:hypothetical protein